MEILEIEWLYLYRYGHRRAKFIINNKNCIISVPYINPSKRKKGKKIVDNFYSSCPKIHV